MTKRTTQTVIRAPGRALCLPGSRGPPKEKVPRRGRSKKRGIGPGPVPGPRNQEEGPGIQDQDQCLGPGPEAEGETNGAIPGPAQGPEVPTAAGVDHGIPEAAVAPGQVDMVTTEGEVTEATVDHPCPVAEDTLVTGITRRPHQNIKKIQKQANAWEYLA